MKKYLSILVFFLAFAVFASEALARKNPEARSVNPQNRSATTKQRMSEVAKFVQELLDTKEAKGGIGKQVREVAQAQSQAQEQTQNQINKLEQRKGLIKKVFGPDYKAVKSLKQLVEQNQSRIKLLEQLRAQATNQGDLAVTQEATQSLSALNISLQELIKAEENVKSLFGWLPRLLAK